MTLIEDPVLQRVSSILHIYLFHVPVLRAPVEPCAVVRRRAPVTLLLEDMLDDINRLAASLAHRYTDTSCVFLHTDELICEAKAALANVLHKGWLARSRTRAELFRILKASMNNRMRSLVQTHRFTQKRTGIKPPPKHERGQITDFESHKPREVSLDDEDAHVQVSEEERGTFQSDQVARELTESIRLQLNWATQRVFDVMIAPPMEALVLAELDACRGSQARIRVNVTTEHIIRAAEGVIDEAGYQKAVLQVQQVTKRLLAMNPQDTRYDVALAALARIFEVQVPKSTPIMVVRRMFTIAARDNWKKVTPEVEADLNTVGATAPKYNHDSMNCFGVLFQRSNKICESCGVRVACSNQAANIGLGEITISPKLLGAKTRRTPFILPNPDINALPQTSNVRDMTIIDYLWRHFKQVTHNGETYMQLREFSSKEKLLFCLGDAVIPFKLRFCKPGPILRKELVYENKCYYLPDTIEAEAAIVMINEHAKYAYGQ